MGNIKRENPKKKVREQWETFARKTKTLKDKSRKREKIKFM